MHRVTTSSIATISNPLLEAWMSGRQLLKEYVQLFGTNALVSYSGEVVSFKMRLHLTTPVRSNLHQSCQINSHTINLYQAYISYNKIKCYELLCILLLNCVYESLDIINSHDQMLLQVLMQNVRTLTGCVMQV